MVKICESCGNDFRTFLSEIKKGKGRFCSKQCYLDSLNILYSDLVCVFCNKHFSLLKSHTTRGRGKYCSNKCYHLSMTGADKGGVGFTKRGKYFSIKSPAHPKADLYGNVPEHIILAEKVLSKKLPHGAVVHHWNGYGKENKDLVICQDTAYHSLIHARERALKEGGNPKLKKCYLCHKYDFPENLYLNNRTSSHKTCKLQYQREYRLKRKGILCRSLSN